MRYRKLSPTGDYVFGGNLLDFYIDTPAAVGQAVQTALLLFLGEWFLDTTVGTPYFQAILGKHSQQTADLAIQNVVINTQGVTAFSNYQSSIDPNTRLYSVSMNLDTVYGPTQVQIQNYRNY